MALSNRFIVTFDARQDSHFGAIFFAFSQYFLIILCRSLALLFKVRAFLSAVTGLQESGAISYSAFCLPSCTCTRAAAIGYVATLSSVEGRAGFVCAISSLCILVMKQFLLDKQALHNARFMHVTG